MTEPQAWGRPPPGSAPVALFYDARFLQHDREGHPENSNRLRAIVERLRQDRRLPPSSWRAAAGAGEADLLLVHRPEMVDSVRRLASGGGGWFDPDTYCTPHSYGVALAAVGAAMAAAELACSNEPLAAFALVRPPGHHATPTRSMGFCLFNNCAIAVEHVRRHLGVGRVAIVDLDVHHGNGTQEIFYSDPDVLYCSLHERPLYPGTGAASQVGEGAGLGATVNLPLPAGTATKGWLEGLDRVLLPAVRRHRPELLAVSVGFDALRGDPLAGLAVGVEGYAAAADRLQEIATDLCGGRTVWFLEGGYKLDDMAEAAAACVSALAGFRR